MFRTVLSFFSAENTVMDVDGVLRAFESLGAIAAGSEELTEKLLAVLNAYPFPALSRKEEWRLKQFRSNCEQQALKMRSDLLVFTAELSRL